MNLHDTDLFIQFFEVFLAQVISISGFDVIWGTWSRVSGGGARGLWLGLRMPWLSLAHVLLPFCCPNLLPCPAYGQRAHELQCLRGFVAFARPSKV